ncbi:MAG: type II toxin-antitoxin system VapC family toxin [Dehalococcoidia bacterium]
MTAIPIDANALIAAADRNDPGNHAVLAVLRDRRYEFVVPALCVAEATYILHKRLGIAAEIAFLAGMGAFDVIAPEPEDWPRIAELVRQYADFPIGGTDASVVVLAERLNSDTVLTLDRRHFGAIRPLHCEAFRLLPEL